MHQTGKVPLAPSDDDLVAEIRKKAGPGSQIAFISGNFNIVHPGHLRLMQFAADNSAFVVVGLNPDTTAGVTMPLALRQAGVSSLSIVDFSLALSGAPEEFIAKLKPEIVVKGKEFDTGYNSEAEVVAAYGGRLLFASGEMRFSSFDLLRREYFDVNLSTIAPPWDYPARHNFSIRDMVNWIGSMAKLRVLVIGDLIVDTYIDCDPLGMSQEDPTIVVTPIQTQSFIGGAAIVAAHCRTFGAKVNFLSVSGDDSQAKLARDRLSELDVDADILLDSTRPTTHKQRYRANGKTLLRVSDLRQHWIEPALARQLLKRVEAVLPNVDLILMSDFNYGCLPQSLVESISSRATKRGIPICADSQASSQYANVSRFKNMRLIKPTEREARLAMSDFDSGLMVLSERLQNLSQAANVVVTLGSEGLLIRSVDGGEPVTDRLPAFNSSPRDVAGAGDAFFACASLALCAGVDIWGSSYVGALASALQVSRVGNTPLSAEDLLSEVRLMQA